MESAGCTTVLAVPTTANGSDRSVVRRASRWLSPVGLVLAGLMLFLPFITVSCDAPGGYGRAAPGGTTTYTGITLLTGGAPAITPTDKVKPVAQRRNDELGAQPLTVALAVLLIAGVVTAIATRPRFPRRIAVAAIATAGLVFLVAEQVTAKALLASRVREELGAAVPPGKQAADYVHDEKGFWLCALALVAVAFANAIGLVRLRRSQQPTVELARAGPSSTTGYG
jgi:hypothetical protein